MEAYNGTPPAAATCSVCFEPWTCEGPHRICCIPCGHVFGRLCLEKCLDGSMSAKCPLCSRQYNHALITNLYAPENLLDGLCSSRLQEVEFYKSKLSACNAQKEATESKAAKIKADMEELASHVAELHEIRWKALLAMWSDVKMEIPKAFMSIKERMKKMIEEKAPPNALIEFMEQTYTQLQQIFNPLPPAPADAEKRRPRRNRPQLPPAPGGPADAVKKRRRRQINM